MRRRGSRKISRNVQVDSLWKLETTTATDSIGGKDGVNNGCTVVSGKIGSGYNFSSSHIDLSVIKPDLTSSFSYGCWLKTSSANNFMAVLDNRGFGTKGSGIPGMYCAINTGSTWIEDINGNVIEFGNLNDLTDGLWHLVGFSWNISEGRLKTVIDGLVVSNRANPAMINSDTSSTKSLLVGKVGSSFYSGTMDEIFFKNGIITDSEFSTIWNNGNGINL